jgi:hypothetical protein
MPEITDSQRMTLELADALLKDSTLGSAARAKAKEMFPDKGIVFPEDRFEPYMAPLKSENDALKARIDAMETRDREREAKAADDAVRQNLEQGITNARAKYSLTAEGFDLMTQRMKETENFTDPEAAAAWVAMQAPKPKDPGPGWAPKSLDLFGSKNYDEQWKQLHDNPEEYQDQQLRQFVADPDAYVRETFGV